MRFSIIITSLLTLGSFTQSVFAQHHHPANVGIPQHHYQNNGYPLNYGRGNYYNAPRNYGVRTGYGYNPYLGFGLVNPAYLSNLSYPLLPCPYPYGTQQYRWCFFRQYGYYPY